MTRISHPECPVCNKRHTYRRTLRARWVAAGLCPRCGAPRGRYRVCASCRTKDSASKKRRYHAKKLEAA